MSYDPYEVIATESAALLQASIGKLHKQVPSCPEWQVRDLVLHVGMVYRTHALHVVRGISDEPTERPEPHASDEGLLLWFEECAKEILGALRQMPADAPAWNWAPHTPQVVRFWQRRMALEAAIHRWDAQAAIEDAQGFELSVAVDGIDEVLTIHRPMDLADEPTKERGVVRVRVTDDEATWTVELTGDNLLATEKTPDAVLSGSASGVFLALWGRVPLSFLAVEGPESLVAALRTG